MNNSKKYCYYIFILGAVFLQLLVSPSFAQSQKEKLQSEKKKIENEINYTNRMIEETRRSTSANVSQLNVLNEQITNQSRLMVVINSEISYLNEEIKNLQNAISYLEGELKTLKEEYAKMIYFSYLTRSTYHRLMFVFASQNMNEAFLRMRYLQEYANTRRRQADMIKEKQVELNGQIIELKQKQQEKFQLFKEQEKRTNELGSQKKEKDKVVQSLKKKEKELLAEAKKKQEAANKLQREIEALIKREIEEANKRTNVKKSEGTSMAMTSAELETSKGFLANKGRLPWPVDNGFISAGYGEFPHPVLPGIKIKNNGIDITTGKGATAKVVFDGSVSAIFTMPNGTKAVIVRHGDYLTVYGNIDNVTVKKDDKVKVNQTLGIVNTDSDNATIIHFEVWKEKGLENPAAWLRKK
jgi:septal ring factor EnvC (AmiA/AmiB activator)